MAQGITVDFSQFKKLERDLETFAKKSIPWAVRNALNEVAFEARHEWAEEQLPKAFTLRNTWTAKGLRVQKVSTRKLSDMRSRVGSIREYMLDAEEGSTQTKRGKHGVAVPQSAASGQGSKAKRTRPVRRPNYLSALQVVKRQGRSEGQRNAISIAMARKSGGVAFIEKGKRKGLFRVGGGKQRKPRLKLLYDLSHSTVTTKPIPTLTRTITAMNPRYVPIYMKSIRAELLRNNVFGYK